MMRQIIRIDEERCVGCGKCTEACHEGALKLIDGKAKLIREDYCDGMGNCLPACPAGAISFENKDVSQPDTKVQDNGSSTAAHTGNARTVGTKGDDMMAYGELSQWPIQLKLVPLRSAFYNGADLLIAADCTAFAHADFHRNFIKDRITVIGCPKFDSGDYVERLAEIFENNDINSITVVRMEVPCCREMERMVKMALAKSQKMIPYRVLVVATDGAISSE